MVSRQCLATGCVSKPLRINASQLYVSQCSATECIYLRIRVFHGEENILGGENGPLGHGLDTQWEAPAVLFQYVFPTYSTTVNS
jgi:hypothetical protein